MTKHPARLAREPSRLAAQEWRPTKEELAAAYGKKVPDVIAPDLHVLFCGINPSLYSAAVGHHFARPGNRFWPVLYHAGFTDRLLSPFEERELLERGIGITNLVDRATARADELGTAELLAGRQRVERKARRYRPRALAVLGVTAYRTAWGEAGAVGSRAGKVGDAFVWVLPNPSGLNAHYQLDDLVDAFSELRDALRR